MGHTFHPTIKFESQATEAAGANAPIERTRLAGRWVRKTLFIIVLFTGFGFWGLLDAVSVYPKRGANVAEYRELKYLEIYRERVGTFDANVSIKDPKAEYARLLAINQGNPVQDSIEETRRQWLESLDRISQLDVTQTSYPREDFRGVKVEDAQLRFEKLREAWSKVVTPGEAPGAVAQRDPPKPLASWDIPSQWGIMFVCWVVAGIVSIGFIKGARKRFTWQPDTQRLTLSDGSSLVPADIEEFDKRRWSKFYVYLKVIATHPQHGGKEVELDLYRYLPLEDWILEMERTRFPERAEAERIEAERVEAERVEAERVEAEQVKTEQAEVEKSDSDVGGKGTDEDLSTTNFDSKPSDSAKS